MRKIEKEEQFEQKVSRKMRKDEKYHFKEKFLGVYGENEVYEQIEEYLKEAILYADVNTDIIDIQVVGSQLKGQATEESDLDVVIEYNNDEYSEDDIFNLLNDEEDSLYFDDIRVDFNPITESKSGNMEEWLERNFDYDKTKEYIDDEGENSNEECEL